ncbi:MAG: AraC family transcriptional regulator, partial [Candidatus Tectomicrobia bacterium]
MRSMRVRGSVYFCDHLQAPWSMEFKDTTSA